MIKFSCVICTKDRLGSVEKCISSIFFQTYAADEIIVVYGGDDIKYYNSLYELAGDIKVIWWPYAETGCCHNFNIGISNAQNDWVAIIDDDAVIPDNWLKDISDAIKSEVEKTAILTTKLVERNISPVELNGNGYNRDSYICTFIEGASVYSRKAMLDVGCFNPRLICYGACRHVAANLLNKGYRIRYLPHVLTHHDKEYGYRSSGFSIACHVRNWIIYVTRYYSVKNITLICFDILSMILRGSGTNSHETIDVSAHRMDYFKASIMDTKWGLLHAAQGILQGIWNIPWAVKNRHVCRHPDFKTFFGRDQ